MARAMAILLAAKQGDSSRVRWPRTLGGRAGVGIHDSNDLGPPPTPHKVHTCISDMDILPSAPIILIMNHERHNTWI